MTCSKCAHTPFIVSIRLIQTCDKLPQCASRALRRESEKFARTRFHVVSEIQVRTCVYPGTQMCVLVCIEAGTILGRLPTVPDSDLNVRCLPCARGCHHRGEKRAGLKSAFIERLTVS